MLSTRKYARLRVGVGDGGGCVDSADHVLGEFSRTEQNMLPHIIDHVAQRLEHWVMCDQMQKVIEATNTNTSEDGTI